MSVVEADEQDRGTVLQYAPRHLRFPAEQQSIRPILQRLSRGDSDPQGETQAEPPRIEYAIPLEPARKRAGWQLLTCSLLSAGLSAGLAVLAIGWFAPAKTDFTRIDAIQLDPKSVHTVSFKQDAPAVTPSVSDGEKQAAESSAAVQAPEPAPPSKTEPHHDQIAPKELLALWSGIPADMPAAAGAEQPESSGAASSDDTASAESETPHAAQSPHRGTAAIRRDAHARHHPRARVAHTQQRALSASAQADKAAPLQSAFQSLFGQSASGSQQPSRQQPAAPDMSGY